ncbi:formate dehydrogenase iron-sulfur subunit [Thermotomaculum hydrothermale]|uniref:Formate dehydrogenase iron-sulfur subunit n=1 Tax=Thermotomaculum hydrothermale TaxID=981385 RepID=A0A7R6PPK6_9BACT|nr:4Fe-4S dicluster domain-containing protein [Thermotomaculum hydrothermale]BBB32021.1 formate dehydrogenase iron-sulfur subunit [Thermotomaculum hydrothermale]
MSKAMLIDLTECAGCGVCAEACKKEHNLPGKVGKTLDYANYTVVNEVTDDVYMRNLCRHCVDPTCASVCPVSALHKTPEGPVVYDFDLCIGCRYCMMACPFQIPKYEWHKPIPQVRKCIMCYDTRIKKGLPTACAEACQNEGGGATYFGERDELLKMAHQRIKDNPDTYHNFVYGEHEVGGTNVMFLLPKNVPLEKFVPYGLKNNLPTEPLPDLTWNVLNKIPVFVPVWATFLTGMWWLNNRKIEVEKNNGIKPKDNDENKGE